MTDHDIARLTRHLRLLERRRTALWAEVLEHCRICEPCRYVYDWEHKGSPCGAVDRQATLAQLYLPMVLGTLERRLDEALGLAAKEAPHGRA